MNQFSTNEKILKKNQKDYKKFRVNVLDNYCYENIRRLNQRIEELRKYQRKMNKVNRYFDKHKGELQGCKYVNDQEIAELYKRQSERIYKGKPYLVKEMYTNAKSIIKIEETIERLEELKKQQCANVQIPNSFMTIEEDIRNNKLKLFLKDAPTEKVRELLKQNTFRWCREDNSWQRILSYGAIVATAKFIKELKGIIL